MVFFKRSHFAIRWKTDVKSHANEFCLAVIFSLLFLSFLTDVTYAKLAATRWTQFPFSWHVETICKKVISSWHRVGAMFPKSRLQGGFPHTPAVELHSHFWNSSSITIFCSKSRPFVSDWCRLHFLFLA
jgi:hypothetical protein